MNLQYLSNQGVATHYRSIDHKGSLSLIAQAVMWGVLSCATTAQRKTARAWARSEYYISGKIKFIIKGNVVTTWSADRKYHYVYRIKRAHNTGQAWYFLDYWVVSCWQPQLERVLISWSFSASSFTFPFC